MDGIREDLNIDSKGNASLAQDSVYSVHMADAGTDSYERVGDLRAVAELNRARESTIRGQGLACMLKGVG